MNVRDWLFVEGHAKALALVLEHGRVGESYNVGGRNERTNLHVVRTICDLLDQMEPPQSGPRHRLISFVDDRPGHDRRYAIDPTKIETELGWRAEETSETGREKRSAGIWKTELGGKPSSNVAMAPSRSECCAASLNLNRRSTRFAKIPHRRVLFNYHPDLVVRDGPQGRMIRFELQNRGSS
jgi:hypothetical protein